MSGSSFADNLDVCSAEAKIFSAENAPKILLPSPHIIGITESEVCGDDSSICGAFSAEQVEAVAEHMYSFAEPSNKEASAEPSNKEAVAEHMYSFAEPTDKDIIAALMKKAGEMKEFSAKFRQVRKVALLTDEVVSTGEMQYRNDGRIMWRYTSPKKQQIAFSAKDIRITEGTQTRIMALDENPYLGQLKDLLMGLMSGKQLDADGRFAVKVVKNDAKSITLSMTPVQRQLKKFISEVVITFTAPDSTVSEVVMKEPDGSSTTITFTDRKVL